MGLQKTKIPARGLKLLRQACCGTTVPRFASKNQNPREGIETDGPFRLPKICYEMPTSKNQNPREGIETLAYIPLGGVLYEIVFKKPKSPRGD